jgi:ergothioneine biosynthesis protein EgtB
MALRSADLGPLVTLAERYRRTRATSLDIVRDLETEDFVAQSMPSVSPTKWHLAHTTWFFERFVLGKYAPEYRVFDDRYHYIFNSYYYTQGDMHARDRRGLLTRPTVAEIVDYRRHVDAAMQKLLDGHADDEIDFLATLGVNHEQQHQELMLTDIKHVLSCNPLQPRLNDATYDKRNSPLPDLAYVDYPGGLVEIGADGDAFCFDNEAPRHRVYLEPFQLGDRLITNGEYRAFIDDAGYRRSSLWLADGWAWSNENSIVSPLYWSTDLASQFTLSGTRDIDSDAPITHISFYEADAFARWADARLPTEAEWESAAAGAPVVGNFVDNERWQPQPLAGDTADGPAQLFGDAWEWTASPYSSYPGFRPLAGSIGEYNGKFMSNQVVCRGGSCVTAADHVRATYRNFFYPHERWQFFGLRLARDV